LERRSFLTGLVAGSASALIIARPALVLAQTAPAPAAPPPVFTLPKLSYAYEALEPTIDAQTMRIHHSLHHQAYVNGANAAAGQWEALRTTPIETVLARSQRRARNRPYRRAQQCRRPLEPQLLLGADDAGRGAAARRGAEERDRRRLRLGRRADENGSIRPAPRALVRAGPWLVVGKDKKLTVISTANQDTPLELGAKPCSASMSGSTPTTLNTRTAGRNTSPPGGRR
jgi:Fe-Mn family superoxide dismutase